MSKLKDKETMIEPAAETLLTNAIDEMDRALLILRDLRRSEAASRNSFAERLFEERRLDEIAFPEIKKDT